MLIFTFTISVLLMILLPVVAGGIFRSRSQAPWMLFMAGTVTFIGSQVVHLPLNSLLADWHVLPQNGLSDPAIPVAQTAIIAGLTAGLCEETARLAGYWLLRKARSLEDGIMLGLGHGGIESMIFGGVLTAATISSLLPLIGTDLAALKLTPEQMEALTQQLNLLTVSPIAGAAAPLVERLLAMTLHVVLSVLVLQAVRRRNPLYYLAAVAYHALVDTGAVYTRTLSLDAYQLELLLALMVLPGLAWLVWMWRREARPWANSGQAQPAQQQWDLFLAAIRKEVLQQWRTQRFLVVMAVFVLFGLTSPLVAKYTPEIIKSIAGAQQFAALIPTPSSADAVGQYIKNITQFGFLLAVLLGMNAVAGEKESGTAAMILSKPMPRWAFVLSKFCAQMVVFASAFSVAGLGAYYYTLILFGAFDPWRFAGINLLLFAWLLPFVAAALLGSVIGRSVAAAAGIGVVISVAILAAGSIPQYGALFPSGLLAWAAALGGSAGQAGANAGALAASLVLVVLCLLWSVALFERQEI